MTFRILAIIAHFVLAVAALTPVLNASVTGIGAVGLVVLWLLNIAGMGYHLNRD